jgi:hypothetical protein
MDVVCDAAAARATGGPAGRGDDQGQVLGSGAAMDEPQTAEMRKRDGETHRTPLHESKSCPKECRD